MPAGVGENVADDFLSRRLQLRAFHLVRPILDKGGGIDREKGKARRGQILRLVAGQAVGLAALGVAAAVPLALGFGRALKSQLYAVSPGDAALLAGVAALAIVVALAASLLPARRATRISPLSALKSE